VGSTPSNPTYTLAAQYVHGGYIDELLVMRRDVDGNGSLEEYFYHADDQFNIVAVTNASGAVVERYEYGPFGEPTILDPSGAVRTESAIGNANLWNGREYDAETGLYYYRLRYLDPEFGRFTTLDPIGLWAPSRALHRHHSQCPRNQTKSGHLRGSNTLL
jgi:RHS repeat-associated protein